MKVAIASQPWDTLQPPIRSGSIPIWTYETAKRLAQTCEVVVYARRSEGQLKHETHQGIEYRRVSVLGNRLCNGIAKKLSALNRSFRYLSSSLYYWPYPVRVALDLRRQQCDVVHIHNFSQFVPVIKALNPQIKIVLHMHCEWLSQFDRQMLFKRLQQTDLVLGCSNYIADKIRARFPEFANRVRGVYNGVDIEQFSPIQESSDTLNLLFIGRISPEKGLHTLISAFEQVADEFPTARLMLIGPNKPTSAEFIAELSDEPMVQGLAKLDPPNYLRNLKAQVPEQLASRVHFTGAVSHLELHEHLQTAAVLVNPSLSEAFGMSLVEAMAAGVCAIATQVGGMQDIVIPHETGLLVEPDNPDALASAMRKLLADKELRVRMGESGRRRAEALFSWEAIAQNLTTHYQSLLIPQNP